MKKASTNDPSKNAPSINTSSLAVGVFYPDQVREGELGAYNATYEHWHRVWVETRREVDPKLSTTSEEFTRQTEILALFFEGKPIATVSHRYVDLRHLATVRDAFFSPAVWPVEVVDRVLTMGRTCVLGSQIYIDPAFRKTNSGLPTKNIACALSFEHINRAKPDILLGRMRKDKGLHELVYRCGGLLLHADATWTDAISLDLIAFFPKKNSIEIDPAFKNLIGDLAKNCPRFGTNRFEQKLRNGEKDEKETRIPYRRAV